MNNRQQRINAEMQRAVQTVITGKVKDPRVSGMISVTRAEVTSDLKHAKIYVSVFQEESSRGEVVEALDKCKNFIRHELMSEIDLRIMPDLKFILDDSVDSSIRISNLLNQLNKKKD